MRKALILALIIAATPALADDVHEVYPTDISSASPVSEAERRRLEEYHTLLHNGLASQGGCNADELPVWIHERCNWRAFGRQTEGGSE